MSRFGLLSCIRRSARRRDAGRSAPRRSAPRARTRASIARRSGRAARARLDQRAVRPGRGRGGSKRFGRLHAPRPASGPGPVEVEQARQIGTRDLHRLPRPDQPQDRRSRSTCTASTSLRAAMPRIETVLRLLEVRFVRRQAVTQDLLGRERGHQDPVDGARLQDQSMSPLSRSPSAAARSLAAAAIPPLSRPPVYSGSVAWIRRCTGRAGPGRSR